MPVLQSAKAESGYGGVLHFGWRGAWAVREGDWKLISTAPGRNGEKPKLTLHLLVGDQAEVKDHAAEKPEVVRRLQKLHADWVVEVGP